MTTVRQAEKIVKKHGGVFLRKAKHGTFYKFENGSRILISGTPSKTGWINDLEKNIKKLLLLN